MVLYSVILDTFIYSLFNEAFESHIAFTISTLETEKLHSTSTILKNEIKKKITKLIKNKMLRRSRKTFILSNVKCIS